MDFRLYLITDRRLVADLPAAVDRALSALPPGAAAIQLREKDLGARALHELASILRPICTRNGAKLFVNDRLDVAIAAGADGLHLAGGSFDPADVRTLDGGLLIGASCHSAAEVRCSAGADFALFSPVFPSPGKGAAVGLEALREAAAGELPLYALGGVDAGNAAACVAAGAAGIAVIRAWLAAGDPAIAVQELLAAVRRGDVERISQGDPPTPMTRDRTLC